MKREDIRVGDYVRYSTYDGYIWYGEVIHIGLFKVKIRCITSSIYSLDKMIGYYGVSGEALGIDRVFLRNVKDVVREVNQ